MSETIAPLTEVEEKRLANIQSANASIVGFVQSEDFSLPEIARMTPRKLFGHVCIANGVCTADNGMALFDVAEQLLEMETEPVKD